MIQGTIRLARQEDVPAMLDIYRPYIESTPFTFETKMPSVCEFEERLRKVLEFTPWLVFETVENGHSKLAGYAYASRHRDREAYRWTVEVSVYVDSKFHRRGIGRALYVKLFGMLREQGFRMALAGVTLPNPSSVHLHESMGFRPCGRYTSVGFKLGGWHDVGWWELSLNDSREAPGMIRPYPA